MSFGVFWFAWIFVGVGFLPFYALHQSSVINLFSVLWGIALVTRLRQWHIMGAVRFLSLGLAAFTVWQAYDGFRSVEAAGGLFALLAVLKLWESYSTRDAFLFFLIFQLMMIAQYLLLESLWLLGFIILSTFLMFSIFMELQGQQRLSSLFKNLGKRRVLAQILFVSLILSTALFFIFPRSTFTFFIRSSKQQMHPWTGFSAELRPGQITSIMQDDSTTFRARFASETPILSSMYWQGATLIDSDGFNWQRDVRISFKGNSERRGKERFLYEADMAEPGEGALFLLQPTAQFKLLSHGVVRWRGLNDVMVTPMSNRPLRWRASVLTELESSLSIEEQESLQRAKELPADVKVWIQENYAEFASLSALELRDRIEELFVRNFAYSLEPGAYSGTPLNQLKTFLLERKVGVCEHFASSAAMIFRAFGHASLVAVGFHGGEYNELGDYWSIRGRDAHAWVLYYDENLGWQRFDPTNLVAPERLSLGGTRYRQLWRERQGIDFEWSDLTQNSWFSGVMKAVDTAYYQLNLAFINYDAEKQRQILANLGLENWRRAILRGISIVFALIVVLVFWLWQRESSKGSWSVVNRIYQAYLKSLQLKGFNVTNSTAPLALQQQLHEQSYASVCSKFIEAYIKIKYDTHKKFPDRDDEKLLRRLGREVRRALRTKS